MTKSMHHPRVSRRRSSLRRRRTRKVVKRATGCSGSTGTKRNGSCRRPRSNRKRRSRRRSLRGGFVRQHSVQQFMKGSN